MTVSEYRIFSSDEIQTILNPAVLSEYLQFINTAENITISTEKYYQLDVLAGKYEVCADDVVACTCPCGGIYSADNENETIFCSVYGTIAEDISEEDDNPFLETGNTQNYFYLANDSHYKVTTWGDLEKFNPQKNDEPGTIIPTGTIFYYKGEYYLFRDQQYLTKSTNLPAYVAHYGVQIKYFSFTLPTTALQPGDVKLENQKSYVFFPYSRYWNDYLEPTLWYQLSFNPITKYEKTRRI